MGSVCAVYLLCVVVFGWAVVQFYEPATGFTSLISIGDGINDRQVRQLRNVPHYVYEDSAGYDGAYYVQLALNPTLENPELVIAIDNFSYRARRILFCWVAWLAGFGKVRWIVQAHALLNVASWFGLGWLLLRWFPATSWDNFLRWFGVMFSHGLCMSVRDSLVDGPSLLLVALGMAAWEDGRRRTASGWLALAGLGRETSLLAAVGFAPDNLRDRPAWKRFFWAAVPAALPLILWVIYLRWRFGPPGETGFNNFTLPLSGLAEKWGATFASRALVIDTNLWWATLALTLAITVQALFFAVRWRPADLWWRIGAIFMVMMLFLSTPVWEGSPGAAGRVLVPMTLAFNILVPRGRAWLIVLLAGNLSVVAAFKEFTPPREFYAVTAPAALVAKVKVERTGGWYGAESDSNQRWRWSSGQSGLRITNKTSAPVKITFQGHALSALDERQLRITTGPAAGARTADAMVWSGQLKLLPANFQFGLTVPPGQTVLSFTTDRAAHVIGPDPRLMAFRIYNLVIAVQPPTDQP
jgi:hypothetical protein